MARIVKHFGIEPAPHMIDGKEQWLCRCGWAERHEAVGDFPGIRRY